MPVGIQARAVWVAVICAAGCLANAGPGNIPPGIPRGDVLFYASYDEAETADIAKGGAAPVAGAGKSTPVPGRVGAARELSGDIKYAAAGNISTTGGTIALWLCPRWDPQDGKHHPLVDWIGNDFRYNRLLLYKYVSNDIYFGLRSGEDAEAAAEIACTGAINTWRTNQWHHLVATWDVKTPALRLYIDGQLAGRSDDPWYCSEMADAFRVGSAGTALDELLIMGRALSGEEVRALYLAHAQDLPEQHTTVNLLRHSSFEDGDTGLPIQYWCRFLDYMRHDDRCGKLDAEVFFHGKQSLRLAPKQSYSFWKELREVHQSYGAKYRFACSAWMKSTAEGGTVSLAVNGWAEDNWNKGHFDELSAELTPRWNRQVMKVEVESGLLEIVVRNTGQETIWVDAVQLCEGWDDRPYCDAYYGSHGEGLWEMPEPATPKAGKRRTHVPGTMPICPAVAEEPVLDGKLDDPAWQQARRLPAFRLMEAGKLMRKRPENLTDVYLCWKGRHLYVAYRCHDQDMAGLMAGELPPIEERPESRDRLVFNNDCVEFFIDTDLDRRTYFHLAIDLRGQRFDSRDDTDRDWDGPWTAATGREDSAWTVEMAIPLDQLGAPATEATVIGVAAARARQRRGGKPIYSAVYAPNHAVRQFRALAFGKIPFYVGLEASEYGEVGSDAGVILAPVGTGQEDVVIQVRTSLVAPSGEKWESSVRTTTVEPGTQTSVTFNTPVTEAGLSQLRAEVWEKGKPAATKVFTRTLYGLSVRKPQEAFDGSQGGRIMLTVRNPAGVSRSSLPVRAGVPFARGVLGSADRVRLTDGHDRVVPCQKRILARWMDGSVMSLLLDFPADVPAAGSAVYTLSYGPGVSSSQATAPPIFRQDGDSVVLDTGVLRMHFPTNRFFAATEIRADFNGNGRIGRRERVRPIRPLALRMLDDAGDMYETAGPVDSFAVEENGSMRGVLRMSGHCTSREGRKLLGYTARLTAWRGKAFCRLEVTLLNDVDAMNTVIREASLEVPWLGVTGLRTAGDAGPATCPVGAEHGAVRVMQVRRVARERPYFQDPEHAYVVDRSSARAETVLAQGDRHTGFFELVGERRLLLAVADFWQKHPQEVIVDADGAEIFLWPRDRVRRLELSVGLKKTLSLVIDFAPPDGDIAALRQWADAIRKPPLVTCPASWYCSSGALGGIYMSEDRAQYPVYEWYLSDFFHRRLDYRENADFTGAFDYGDDVKSGLGGWHNNQTMFIHHLLVQYARTLEPRYWYGAEQLLRHMADTDTPAHRLVRKDCAGSVASPGSFRHTDKFPSPSHNWSEGALDYYLLTGEPWALDEAKGICDWLARYNHERLSSGRGGQPYRSHGWPLMQVSRLYEVTREKRYLESAKELVNFLVRAEGPQGGWLGHGRSVFHGGTCCHGLWRYVDVTGDEAIRRYALKMTDWLLAERPEDMHDYYPWTWRETVFFGPLARAYADTGNEKYLHAGMRHLYAGFDRGFIWTTAPFTAELMRHARELGLPEPVQGLPHGFNVIFDHTVYVREDEDREFEFSIHRVRTPGTPQATVVGYGPGGKRVVEWTEPPHPDYGDRVYETSSLRVPKDGVTGTYRFETKVGNSKTSYRCSLPKLVVKGGAHGGRWARYYFTVPVGTERFRLIVRGPDAKPRYSAGAQVYNAAGELRGRAVWWKTVTRLPKGARAQPNYAIDVHPAKEETGKVWSLRTSDIPYLALEGVPPYLAKHAEACFVPE